MPSAPASPPVSSEPSSVSALSTDAAARLFAAWEAAVSERRDSYLALLASPSSRHLSPDGPTPAGGSVRRTGSGSGDVRAAGPRSADPPSADPPSADPPSSGSSGAGARRVRPRGPDPCGPDPCGPDPFAALAPGRTLDDYVEAQLHGGLVLGEHVTAVVACPSLRGTPAAAHLGSLGMPVFWHAGFELAADEFPAELRGPRVPPLAREIAARYGRAVLDAEVIGRAARAAAGDPERLQQIKYLWHILVLLGRPHSGA
nr:DUF3626 domain-containing protein [Actinoplanes sp. OR16]